MPAAREGNQQRLGNLIMRSSIRIAALAALLIIQVDPSGAQAPWDPRRPDPAARAQAQQLWDQYRDGAGRGGSPEPLFRIVNSRALPATRENAAAVVAILRSNVSLSRDEKILLIRIAAAQAQGLDDSQAKSEVQGFLSGLAMSTEDPVLGNAAALESGSSFSPESLAVLERAHAKGHISDDDYFGQIARLLPEAPGVVDQMTILKLVAEGKNSFATEILAAQFLERRVVNELAPVAVVAAAAILAQNEPTFSNDPTRIGGIDVIRYGSWMNAMVGLNAKITGEPERVVMARLLKIDGANPKALIAVLIDERNAALVRTGLDRRSLEKIDIAIAAFAENSHNAWVQEVAATARANLVEPKK